MSDTIATATTATAPTAVEEVPTCPAQENLVQECPVCIEKYNKVRREVECPKCLNTACHRCTQRYICETIEDPHCMHCKHPFNRQFLNQELTKTFMKGEYVQKRRDILWSREESYIPGAMVFVPLLKEKEELRKTREETRKLIADLEDQLNANQRREYTISRALDTGVLPDQNATAVKEIQQKFVRRCIKEDCKGWLSTHWKCDICTTKVCPDCYQVKLEDHECKKEDVDTAEYIKKNAKNCPKCGEMIEKKDGCDQMFCTSCHTAFSWKTLEIVKGAIHNPHYFAWRNTHGVQEHTIGDIQCGGVPDVNLFKLYSDISHKYHVSEYYNNDTNYEDDFDINTSYKKSVRVDPITDGRRSYNNSTMYTPSKHYKVYKVFSYICRHLEHMRSYTQRHGAFFYDDEAKATKLRHMRLEYLSNNISKELFQKYLAEEEKKRENMTILSQPIDTLYNAGADILRRGIPSISNIGVDLSIVDNKTPENYEKAHAHAKKILEEYNALIDFINNIYEDISIEFNVKVPRIDKFARDTMKNYNKEARKARKTVKKPTIRTPTDDSDSDYEE
jgi:hypothetical protein